MADVHELIAYLDDELEVSTIDDFCPNGLQVEGKNRPINCIATAVSASLETLRRAIEIKPDVLIVHHGLFWEKDSHRILGVKKEKIQLLFDHDITLLAYHLPLDCHKEWGNNFAAAKQMGWKDLQGFGQHCGHNHLGVMGTVNLPVEEFKQKLESFYDHPAAAALGGSKTIKRAALISGGAHREIHKAIKAGVDAFITGSFDEPIWHVAFEEKINFFAMGHSNTETIGPKALGEHLASKFNISHQFIDVKNPF